MSNQDNKLADTLDKLDHIIKLRKRIESQNTKAHNSPSDYECQEGYRHRLIDKLQYLRQGDLSVRDYITRFENLTHCCDVREYCSQITTRFVSGLTSDIRRTMITSLYDVNSIEDTFDFALKMT